jgi:hypothetical protein
MRILGLLSLFVVFCQMVSAQTSGGVAAEWNTRESITAMAQKLGEVKPILTQLKAEQWVANGASEGYIEQLKSLPDEIYGVEWSLGNLAKSPEKLTFAVDAYLRVQALRGKINSVNEAVRRYQNPAIAELIDAYLVESAGSQNQLQVYLRELAELKESELAVMETEAQRCRVQQIQRRP